MLLKNNGDIWDMNLDYADKNNVTSLFTSEGNIHPYPAKTVPNMVHDLLLKIKDIYKSKNVLDPFVGSGTVALESKLLGLDFYGSDLNPLAVLLAQVKSLTIKDTPLVKEYLERFINKLNFTNMQQTKYIIENFKNIDYWFKKENIEQLSYIKRSIHLFLKRLPACNKKDISLIILTAFSTTIRESSLTRIDEFKLYRLSPQKMAEFNVNSLNIFVKRVNELLNMIQYVNSALIGNTKSEIFLHNAKDLSFMRNTKVDIILTSPPYGDSKSTVAYGQFSKLSLQWMSDLMKKYLDINTENKNCDEYLLGGKHSIESYSQESIRQIVSSSNTLNRLLSDIEELTKKELADLKLAKTELVRFLNNLNNPESNINCSNILNDNILSVLIREKIRLHIYREFNKNIHLSKKQVKVLTTLKMEKFISELAGVNPNKNKRRRIILKKLIPNVIDAINNRINLLPKRGKEILEFFIDLNKVIEESNKVLSNKGIQIWVVGHRTVLGNLKINLANILLEWFENINYVKIALIKRNCYFKRLPRHINSTATRDKKINTMMEEYVLIIQKS